MAGLSFALYPQPPFRLDLTVWALRRRPHNLVDRWDGETYRRVLALGGEPMEVAVTQVGPRDAPELLVRIGEADAVADQASGLRQTLTRMLGLDLDLGEFYRAAAGDGRLNRLAQRFLGVKPPRFPSLFEALVNAVACQQLSLTLGIHLLNRLVAAFGVTYPGGDARHSAFPRPQDLAGQNLEALRALGFSRNKARALIELSRGLASGELDLGGLAALDDAAASQTLQTLRGIGRWSAEYVLLRGLGRWHLFPGDDVGARHALQTWLKLTEPLDYQGVQQTLARWRRFGGLIYFHFLLNHLAAAGQIQEG